MEFGLGFEITTKLQKAIDEVGLSEIESLNLRDAIEKTRPLRIFRQYDELEKNNYDEVEMVKQLEESDESVKKLRKLRNELKHIGADFISKAQTISNSSNSKVMPQKFEVDETKVLIMNLSTKRQVNANMVESDSISLLMGGEPFGRDFLNKMHSGVTGYSESVQGKVSLKKWKEIVNQARYKKKRQVDQKDLIGRIEGSLKNVEPLKIASGKNLTIYAVLQQTPVYKNELRKYKNAIKAVKSSNELKSIKTDLEVLKNDPSVSGEARTHVEAVYKTVVSIENGLDDRIGGLIESLDKLITSLAYVNCNKFKNDPKCQFAVTGSPAERARTGKMKSETTSSDGSIPLWVYVLVGVVIVAVLVVGAIVFKVWSQKKNKKKEEDYEIIAKRREENFQNEKEALNKDKPKLQKDLNEAKENIVGLENKVGALEESLSKNEQDYKKLTAQLAQAQAAGSMDNQPLLKKMKEIEDAVELEFQTAIDQTRFSAQRGFLGGLMKTETQYSASKDNYKRFIREQFENLKAQVIPERVDQSCFEGVRNPSKPLYVKNRVRLENEGDKITLHASKMSCFKNENWIAMQAPETSKNEATYDMIFQENVSDIVQLCMSNEHKHKIDYTKKGQHGKYTVEHLGVKKTENITELELKVSKAGGESRNVKHHLYEGWKSKEAPNSPVAVVELVMKLRPIAKKNCVAVHCQGGNDRTMTFIGVAYLISLVDGFTMPVENEKLWIAVATLRAERFEAVQTYVQYAFLELCMAYYYTLLKNQNDECNAATYDALLQLYSDAYDDLAHETAEMILANGEKK